MTDIESVLHTVSNGELLDNGTDNRPDKTLGQSVHHGIGLCSEVIVVDYPKDESWAKNGKKTDGRWLKSSWLTKMHT